jgi:hypothetical protein
MSVGRSRVMSHWSLCCGRRLSETSMTYTAKWCLTDPCVVAEGRPKRPWCAQQSGVSLIPVLWQKTVRNVHDVHSKVVYHWSLCCCRRQSETSTCVSRCALLFSNQQNLEEAYSRNYRNAHTGQLQDKGTRRTGNKCHRGNEKTRVERWDS